MKWLGAPNLVSFRHLITFQELMFLLSFRSLYNINFVNNFIFHLAIQFVSCCFMITCFINIIIVYYYLVYYLFLLFILFNKTYY